MPGVVVDATHVQSGIVRTDTSDGEGNYRLAGLPIGTYEVTTQLPGFKKITSTVTVNVASNTTLDLKMVVEEVKETIVVQAPAPRESGREHVVDLGRVSNIPLNGNQIGDIAATLPAVSGGYHSDVSKGNQRVAATGGNGGRATAFLIDGGDNNDDTVGGLAQAIPLESIEEFKFHSQGADAEFGRGAIMNIITRSGTNAVRGSWFTMFRDDAMNARTFTEQLGNVEKQGYRRYQYGGSVGGPFVRNKAHYFMAYEGTRQDTMQIVATNGLFPGDGLYAMQVRQDLFSTKVTATPTPSQYLAIRYARDHNSQPSGASRTTSYSAWATSTNDYDSLNVNHNWSMGRNSLNEFLFQFSDYVNDAPATANGPAIVLADTSYRTGASQSSPQSAAQRRWQFRDDYSWTMSGKGGLSHEFRAGASVVHTPRLFVENAALTNGQYTMRTNDINGGVASLLVIGGTVSSNIPTDLYGFYFQDDWRVTNRLTLNVGVRYDYLSGIPIEQTSANFAAMQLAGQSGRFAGTFLEDFGREPRGDRDNIQPRLGAVYDLSGNGRNLFRAGWGIHTDLAYTNSNVLTTSLEGGGIILSLSCLSTSTPTTWCDPARGFQLPDTSLFTVNHPWQDLGVAANAPTTGEVVSPRLQQPFSYQTNFGWSHELNRETTLTVDYVRVDGRNLNMRMRPNVDIDPTSVTTRYLAGIGVTPNSNAFRTAVSAGRSRYDAVIFGGRRRWSSGFDLDASYTLSKSTSDVGTAADELTQNLLQDVNNPFSDFQMGPSTRVDARHRVTASAIVQAPYGVRVASIFSFRSALPVTTLAGSDLNGDGVNNDHSALAYRYTGLNDNGSATFEEAGICETVNCSRRAPFSQLNLRVSRSFKLMGTTRIEAIAEVFNVFNAKNPFLPLSTNVPASTFMQPTAYAGDLGQGEQRVGQLGFRFTF